MYHPAIGRFLQVDPIGYWAGLNLYKYCGNDPVNWIDPLGFDKEKPNEEPAEPTGPDAGPEPPTPGEKNPKGFDDRIRDVLDRIRNTARGKELIEETLEKGTGIEETQDDAYYDTRTNEIYVDPDFHPNIETIKGKIPASTERILAHEMQHAIGTHDEMETIQKGENPVAVELGEPPRIRY